MTRWSIAFACEKVVWLRREICTVFKLKQQCWWFLMGFFSAEEALLWIMDLESYRFRVRVEVREVILFPFGCRTHRTLASVWDVRCVWGLWANRQEMHSSSCLWTNKLTLLSCSPEALGWKEVIKCYSEGKMTVLHVLCHFWSYFWSAYVFVQNSLLVAFRSKPVRKTQRQNITDRALQNVFYVT